MKRKVSLISSLIVAPFLFGLLFAPSTLHARESDCRTDSVAEELLNTITPVVEDVLDIPVPSNVRFILQSSLDSILVDVENKVISIYANEGFGSRNFTPEMVSSVYGRIKDAMPADLPPYEVRIYSCGKEISEYVPNHLRERKDHFRLWKEISYTGKPWVENISRPFRITRGLQNRHLALWASHGRFWQNSKQRWEWQRPSLYCTTEDMFTLSFVTPFLLPMLENSGAVCFSARERDWQLNEVIVDNDDARSGFQATSSIQYWQPSSQEGFRNARRQYGTGESPFRCMEVSDTLNVEGNTPVSQDSLVKGTALWTRTVSSDEKASSCCWMPTFVSEGDYAVYVTYQSFPESTDEAVYRVVHQGTETLARVNQTMGGGTWVYLGTFHFDKGRSARNAVFLTNQAQTPGKVISADAVRFGGGMGNIAREEDGGPGVCSGLPRFLEGARYYAQYAGFPAAVYDTKGGHDDYGDEINTRAKAVNWLAGGSPFVPDTVGCRVPIELSLAVHSDAGYNRDNSTIGTLVINTLLNDTLGEVFRSGLHRMASSDFADMLQNTIAKDFSVSLDPVVWYTREHYRRNYGESRSPEMPSAILEMLSHQNFTDMLLGHDPNFKFLLSRSVYKAVLKFVSSLHETDYVVHPLPVKDFSAVLEDSGKVRLSWTAQQDVLEESASPAGYVVYTQRGDDGFDNGVLVSDITEFTVKIDSGKIYSFKVTAVNEGGESFPSEVLTAYYSPRAKRTALIINGFTRLSSPAIISTADKQGFCLAKDYGVPYMQTPEYCGEQTGLLKRYIGKLGERGLGYSSQEMVGKFVKGNTFDYPLLHGKSLVSCGDISFCSSSMGAVEKGLVQMSHYSMVDLVLGLQKNCGKSSMRSYKTFSRTFQDKLKNYLDSCGKVFLSGSYIGSDMSSSKDRDFIRTVLGFTYVNSVGTLPSYNIRGNGIKADYEYECNQERYAVQHPDRIRNTAVSRPVFRYPDGTTAGVSMRKSQGRAVSLAVPFESIRDENQRNALMKEVIGILYK